MSDMEQSVAEPNSEAEVVEPQGEEHISNDEANTSNEDSQEQPTDEELAEIEVDGVKFDMPKAQAEKLKAERMMQADYTQKTQAHAERVRAFEAEQQQRVEADQRDFVERAKLHQIDDTLKQYSQVDWQAAYDQDPIAAGKAQAYIQQLNGERARLEGNIAQNQQQRALSEQQSTAKQVQEAEAYVSREIPGWTEARGEQLKNFAAAEGLQLTPEVAKVLIKNPAFFKIMNKAEMFNQMEKKQSVKTAPPSAPSKPITRVNVKGTSGQVDPNKMSADEWRVWRDSQIAQKRKR